jgi:AcrR family transcriptional regulator
MKLAAAVIEHLGEERHSRKEQSFDDLLCSAVYEIAAKGIDHVTVGDITKASGNSRTTFYTYFGDLPGLCAEIWIKFGRAWLESKSTTLEPSTYVSDFHTALDSALLDIFASAHRMPEVLEVVQPDCTSWWREQVSDSSTQALSSVWILATKLGTQISTPVTSGAAECLAMLPLFELAPPVKVQDLFFEESLSHFKPSGIADTGQISVDIDSMLMMAALSVVASSGVSAASMSRVARKTRVSTGSVYPKFKNIDEVVLRAFNWSIRRIVESNSRALTKSDHPGNFYGEIVIGGLSEERTLWRNFRLEMHLEARLNPRLAAHMSPGLDETNQILVNTISDYQVPKSMTVPVTYLMQTLAVGFSLLHNAGIPVNVLDHRIMTNFMIGKLLEISKQ